MKKRMLSMLLAVCMLVIMIPAAFAAQVTTPTGLFWNDREQEIWSGVNNGDGTPINHLIYPWDMVWDRVENGSNDYYVALYKDGELIDSTTWSFSSVKQPNQLDVDMFRTLPRESGTYTFSITAKGDGQSWEDSEVATSASKVYTAPAVQLPAPTNLRWNGATAEWDAVEGAYAYAIDWYHSETADGAFEPAGYTWGWMPASIELEDWVVLENGAGYYSFEVRALSNDVDAIRPSELSVRSGVYNTDGATESIKDSLDEIANGLNDTPSDADVAQAVEQVKNLDSKDLYTAMEADRGNAGIIEAINKIEDATGIALEKSVDTSLRLDSDKISLSGARLNAATGVSEVTFNVSKPDGNVETSAAYTNTVAFDFKLDGATPEPDGEFAVPIKITMPVPDGIIPERLRILHYRADGSIEEKLLPYVFEDSGTWYASFVVTHFSTFVFANSIPAAQIGSHYYDTLQAAIDAAASGATVSLYRNNDDTEIRVTDKSLNIDCNTYYLRDDVHWELVGCSKTETTDSEGHRLIVITRTSGSSNGSSSGGSSSSGTMVSVSQNNNGTIAVSPSRAQTGDTVTVTIEPDEGYMLDELIVTDRNGKRVEVTRVDDNEYTFIKPSGLVKVEATFTEDTGDEPVSTLPFTDIAAGAWYSDAVGYVYEHGIMNGTSATEFSPDETTTRGMIVTMLHRLEDEPQADAADFSDVSSSMYYADAVAWAAANDIVNGISNTAFAPDSAITREQLAAILYRYAQYKGYDTDAGGMSLDDYTDADQISSYAVAAMQWANSEGLITGRTNTTLAPQGTATRAEVATILMRFIENIA